MDEAKVEMQFALVERLLGMCAEELVKLRAMIGSGPVSEPAPSATAPVLKVVEHGVADSASTATAAWVKLLGSRSKMGLREFVLQRQRLVALAAALPPAERLKLAGSLKNEVVKHLAQMGAALDDEPLARDDYPGYSGDMAT